MGPSHLREDGGVDGVGLGGAPGLAKRGHVVDVHAQARHRGEYTLPVMRLAALGPLERRVMEHFWANRGGATVRDVRAKMGSELAYTTLMTTLDRLHKKGLLDRRREGRAFVYAARQSRGEFHGGVLRRLLDGALGTGTSAAPVLSSLVDTVGDVDRALLDELGELVRRKQRSGSRRGTP